MTMEIIGKKDVRDWYILIEDGVPQDVALQWLRDEATRTGGTAAYRNSWANTHSDKIPPKCGLTDAEYLALRMYTKNDFYYEFNADCRKRTWKPYIVFTSLLHSGLKKLRRKPSDEVRTLYRGLNCEVKRDIGDLEFYMPSFTSASASPQVAEKFGETNIVTVETSRASSLTGCSAFPYEKETLFSPFQSFVVLKKDSKEVFKTSIQETIPFIASPLVIGAMIGAVVGNCVGSDSEFGFRTTAQELEQRLSKLEKQESNKGRCRYNCDTCMTLALAKSITGTKGLNVAELKKSFAEAYFKDKGRNYGASVRDVLEELHKQKTNDDHFGPAKKLFGGKGSYGNGGAMRITPAALYFYNHPEHKFIELMRDFTALTHSNTLGINGAILQATAVQQALVLSIYENKMDDLGEQYLKALVQRMEWVEKDDKGNGPYCTKLNKIQELLKMRPRPNEATIIDELGNGITAFTSVPTAIYCFLRGLHPIEGVPDHRTEFERTVIYALSLGGDTDTIASMAGAIAGAYYGQDSVTQRWRLLCEGTTIDEARRYAKEIASQIFWK